MPVAPNALGIVHAADPRGLVLLAADAFDRAIDDRVGVEELAGLRRHLDESFAAVLDTLAGADHTAFRSALVEQFVCLSGSLDAFERRAPDLA
jgi:hypothetical protein